MSSHAAVVLAAGGSRRLGRPKQLLERGGEALVHLAVRLAQATSPTSLLLVLGAQPEPIAKAVKDLAARSLFNVLWEDGMSSSLRLASIYLYGHYGVTLLLGCDQPALELRHLQQLLEGAHASPAGNAATAFPDGRLGLPAAISASMLRGAPTLFGDRGFGDRLSELRGVWRLEAPELQLDVDVEADVAAAIEAGWLDADGSKYGPASVTRRSTRRTRD